MSIKKSVVLPAALLFTLALSGCQQTTLLTPQPWGGETRAELETWTIEQAVAAIEVTGIPDGWRSLYTDIELTGESDRAMFADEMFTRGCFAKQDYVRPEGLSLILKHEPSDDPLAALEQLRVFWESEGWDVVNFYSPEQEAELTLQQIRAKKDDGSLMMYHASDTGQVLEVSSVCSVHTSVTG